MSDSTQSETGAVRASTLLFAALPWVGTTALGAWLGSGLNPLWLAPAAAGFVIPLLLLTRPPGVERAARTAALLLGVVLVMGAFGVQSEARRVAERWDEIWVAREARIAAELEGRLDRLLRDGRAGAVTLAAAAEGGAPPLEVLQRIRRGRGFDAVAVFDAAGTPVVWDGVHRGRVPQEVAVAGTTYQFGGPPLARHLYVTEATADGGTVMLARLIDSDLPPEVRRAVRDLAIVVEERHDGADLRFDAPDRVEDSRSTVFDYGIPDATLVSVRIDGISSTVRLAQLSRETRRFGSVLVVLLWIALAFSAGGGRRSSGLAVGAAWLMAAVLPLESVFFIDRIASPADSLLLGAPLGRWAWFVLAALVTAGVLRRSLPRGRVPRGAGAALVALTIPLGAAGVANSVSDGFLVDAAAWAVVASIMGLAFALVLRLGIDLESRPPARDAGAGERSKLAVDTGPWVWGVVVAAGIVATLTVLAVEGPGVPVVVLASAGVPVLFWHRLSDGSLRGVVTTWILALGVGSALALPTAWGERIASRIAVADAEMARLGLESDPYLDFLLREMAVTADSLDARGLRPVELLYQTWRNSGLGDADYPIYLTLWLPSGVAREDLRIGAIPAERPAAAREAFEDADPLAGVTLQVMNRPDAWYVLTVPLRDGRTLTGVVPPLRDFGRATLLGPLFESLDRGSESPLALIPLRPGEESATGPPEWIRTGGGWSGERTVAYPDGDYHAHWEVDLPRVPVLAARGTLLAALHLGLGLVLVSLGLLLFGGGVEGRSVLAGVLEPLGSFRARITLALFVFFAISNLVFGSIAYRTIEGASRRAAELLATEAAEEAGQIYLEVGGVIDFLAQRVGTEVLEYRDGELREGSIEPLVELGLYEAWVPWDVQREIDQRERVGGTRTTVAGPWRYVTAFGRLPDGDVIGAPVPLDAGADAVRQAEVRDLLAFAMLLGAAVSLVLALAVGRALARPIATLRLASERVGSGNLDLRLPEGRSDEFGAVFQAFNRMVRRLRRARRTLVRTNRRTRAIVAEAATGMLAVDALGRVSLANERARALLGSPLEEGMPVNGESLGDVGDWLNRYFREGPMEAGSEIQLGERRIRVRVRRIAGEEESGAVVSLEDVTDELRTERVLAWGEMARQVAHEVKNPLTPIKLSVQHLQRAHRDGRRDFGEILERNAEAMLREIDRLADIASSFSRLGAPEAAGAPIEPVILVEVVDEVLALYRTGQGNVTFSSDVPPDLPPVRARRSEVKEVLVNLLENARAAMESGGRVRITGGASADGVLLSVRDDGPGIDVSLLARVFEPHFSTRSTGTGLGLAIVRRLVESWGGEVSLTSTAGEGTVVTLRLDPHTGGEGGPRSDGHAV